MSHAFNLFLETVNPSIVERIDIPPRPEKTAAPPDGYYQGPIGSWMIEMTKGKGQLWSHQAKALELIEAKHHVLISTGTGSGKSLAFQAPIMRMLLEEKRGKALILMPQKALSGDQHARWGKACRMAGVDETLIGEINGQVPTADRDRILDTARVILMTPDVAHAWMMRGCAGPAVKAFLGELRFGVIDEAHSYDGVFGSNSAYFFRRLLSVAARIKAASDDPIEPLQLIAASATIADPAGHMERLTGCAFSVIDERENGAPHHGLTLLHIEGPGYGKPAEKMLADYVAKLAAAAAPDAVMAFADGRQSVERVARATEAMSDMPDAVLPYRAGYEAKDRKAIEGALRDGELHAVVATSALELGIDIPQFTIGINLGVPQTRKAFHQRAGRVGRASGGVFALIAPGSAFSQLGGSFREFYEGEVEPAHLYLDNRAVQFQQACCLLEECDWREGVPLLPDNVSWPEGFAEVFALAMPQARRPADLDRVARLGTGTPHHDYPLRRICEVEYSMKLARDRNVEIAKIPIDKALREAYPGAIHFHMRRGYRVIEWRTSSREHTILVEPTKGGETSPILTADVSVSHEPDELVDQRILLSDAGSIAETRMQVSEAVIGYSTGSTKQLYSELRKVDPRKTWQRRNIETTGIVIRIAEPWFQGGGEHQVAARRALAYALETVLAREHSIAPGDIRSAHVGVSLWQPGGPRKLDDAIVVFDDVYGGLRLTARLFDDIELIIDRLRRGVELAGVDALISAAIIDKLENWFLALEPANGEASIAIKPDEDERLIYAANSTVGVRLRGMLQERRLLDHQLVSMGEAEMLMYRYETAPGVIGLVPHDQIEPIGGDWRYQLLNLRTGAVREADQ